MKALTAQTVLRPIEILLVDDDDDVAVMTQKLIEKWGINVSMRRVGSGTDAMAYLRMEGDHANATRPDLIMLDLYMPEMNGRQILAQLMKDQDLRTIPVVMLSASESTGDIETSYVLNAGQYVAKPLTLEKFVDIIKSLDGFCLTVVKCEES